MHRILYSLLKVLKQEHTARCRCDSLPGNIDLLDINFDVYSVTNSVINKTPIVTVCYLLPIFCLLEFESIYGYNHVSVSHSSKGEVTENSSISSSSLYYCLQKATITLVVQRFDDGITMSSTKRFFLYYDTLTIIDKRWILLSSLSNA